MARESFKERASTRTLSELIVLNRSYRRFDEEERISLTTLKSLINLARLSASASNLQPLKYIISTDPAMNARIFSTLAWAGYIKDWGGPKKGERPSAYIVILGDKRIKPMFGCDHGIAAQSILLGAVEKDFGGCMIGSIRREELAAVLDLKTEIFEILMVLALGKPVEKVVLEDMEQGGDIKYYRDEREMHHVPKRKLEDLIVKTYG